jgi:hypothetical protein
MGKKKPHNLDFPVIKEMLGKKPFLQELFVLYRKKNYVIASGAMK